MPTKSEWKCQVDVLFNFYQKKTWNVVNYKCFISIIFSVVLLLTSQATLFPVSHLRGRGPTSNWFQLAITPKVFHQIQTFFHRNAQKNLFVLDWLFIFYLLPNISLNYKYKTLTGGQSGHFVLSHTTSPFSPQEQFVQTSDCQVSCNWKIILKTFLCLKTKQNTEMSDEEHPDSESYLILGWVVQMPISANPGLKVNLL